MWPIGLCQWNTITAENPDIAGRRIYTPALTYYDINADNIGNHLFNRRKPFPLMEPDTSTNRLSNKPLTIIQKTGKPCCNFCEITL